MNRPVPVFLYGRQIETTAASWCADVPQRGAAVRGAGWLYLRGARAIHGLVPDPAAPPVSGLLLEVPLPRMPLLGLLLEAHGLQRTRVVATVDLQGVEADAWVLPSTPAPRSGWHRARRGGSRGTTARRPRPT
jgi:hypothetical protein